MTEELLPCPFCGAGETQIKEQLMWGGQSQTILSVSVMHWCEVEPGQPSRAIERIGKDRESAIKAWNRRPVKHSLLPVLSMTLLDGTPRDQVFKKAEWPFPSRSRAETDKVMQDWKARESALRSNDVDEP